MRIFLVGGAVRDELMGIVPKDHDYVVVGSTPEEMLEKGFKQVGSDFPVFLHPETGDEYALARTEKSTGDKYQDFDCYFGKDVTLEDDLSRRDLTINAIAKDVLTGELVDPYNAATYAIPQKILTPISSSFREDPVRVLRAARFLSTHPEFKASKALEDTCYEMYLRGELSGLTAERVWKEMEKALNGIVPGVFFTMLTKFDLFPEIQELYLTPQKPEHHPEGDVGIHTMMVVDYAARHYGPIVAFAGLCHDFGKPVSYAESGNALQHEIKGLSVIMDFCDKWKVPNNYRELALMTCEYHTKVHGCLGRGSNKSMRPKSVMRLFENTKALSKPERFINFLEACESDAKGRGGDYPNKPYRQKDYLLTCLEAVLRVNTRAISAKFLTEGKAGLVIGEAIRVARIDAIRKVPKP